MSDWTIDKVKRDLPYVPLEYRGKVYQARIMGRKLDFPHLSIEVNQGDWRTFEYAWQTIVNILNTGGKAKVL